MPIGVDIVFVEFEGVDVALFNDFYGLEVEIAWGVEVAHCNSDWVYRESRWTRRACLRVQLVEQKEKEGKERIREKRIFKKDLSIFPAQCKEKTRSESTSSMYGR